MQPRAHLLADPCRRVKSDRTTCFARLVGLIAYLYVKVEMTGEGRKGEGGTRPLFDQNELGLTDESRLQLTASSTKWIKQSGMGVLSVCIRYMYYVHVCQKPALFHFIITYTDFAFTERRG